MSKTKRSSPRSVGVIVACGFVLATTPSPAQIVPMTSAQPWFNSPSRRSPFNQFKAAEQVPVRHIHRHGSDGATVPAGEPC